MNRITFIRRLLCAGHFAHRWQYGDGETFPGLAAWPERFVQKLPVRSGLHQEV